MNGQFFLGAGIGWVCGLFFGRFVVGNILNTIRGSRMFTWLKKRIHQGTAWLRAHVRFAGIVIIILALSNGLTYYQYVHVTSCVRDYVADNATAQKARSEANAPTQAALRNFIISFTPFLAGLPSKKPAPTQDDIATLTTTFEKYSTASKNLDETLKAKPLPPIPDTFCGDHK